VREEDIPLEAKRRSRPPRASIPSRRSCAGCRETADGPVRHRHPHEFGGPDIYIVTRCCWRSRWPSSAPGSNVPCYGTFGGAGWRQIFEANEDPETLTSIRRCRGEKKPFFG